MSDTNTAASEVRGAAETLIEASGEAATTAAAIEHAEDRIEAAERTAEQIADAVLATELGRRIEAAETKVAECLTAIQSQETRLLEAMRAELSATTEALANAHADALAALRTELAQPGTLPVSTPPNSEAPTEPEPVTIQVAKEPESEVAPVVPARIKRNRFL